MVPKGAALDTFQAAITKWAGVFGSPTFIPHVTLVAGLMDPVDQVTQRTRAVAAGITPFAARVKSVTSGSMYFQSVYARLESDTDVGAAIVAANKAAQLALTPGKLVDYMPHLSLVYGDFTDADKVEAIRELDKALSGLEFNIESVQVWSTQGEVSEWYLVDDIPFSAVPEAPAASQADQGTDERKDSDS